MHLSVTCPQCSSKYQLDPSMRGKRMRCPNTLCRAVFDVRDDNDPLPQTPAPDAKVTTEAWQPPPTAIQEAPPAVKEAVKVKEPPPAKPKPAPLEPKRP